MKALLVYPRFPVTYWGFQYGMRIIGKKATLPPLGLLTVAALLPKDWHLRLVDLNMVETLDDDHLRWADVVLTGGLLIQVPSILDIIARASAHGRPVMVGGPAPTASPDLFGDANVVFRGEAESRIDELVRALERSSRKHLVLEAPSSFPEMTSVPVPRFDLIELSKYASVSVQYSRGCPFQCEFCDVIEIFGRKQRTKTPEQVVKELDAIHQLGYRGTLFFVDDNFIGNKAAVKRLLPIIRDWQRSHGTPFELYTEASINLATDSKLLDLMVAAGFTAVFVGIETPSEKALEETKKFQNLRVDLSEAIDRITGAGLQVMGGFIVGFDSDDEEVFALQREFLARQPIPLAMVGILTALPGTGLWRRLEKEGRLRERSTGDQFDRPNFVPVMEEDKLLEGYSELMTWLYSPKEFYGRCLAHLRRTGSINTERRPISVDDLGAFFRAMWHVGVRSPRRRLFWPLMLKAISKGRCHLRQAVTHAIQGEHLFLYTREHLVPRMERALAALGAELEQSLSSLPTTGEEGPPAARLLSHLQPAGTMPITAAWTQTTQPLRPSAKRVDQ